MQWGGTKWGKRRLNRDSLNENGAPFRLVLSPPLITHSPQLFDLIQQQNSSNCNNFYGCSPRSIFLYFWDPKHLFLTNVNVYKDKESLYSRLGRIFQNKSMGIKNSSSIKIDHDIKQYSKSNSCYTFEQS